jgi:hypothetical protein
LCEKRWPAALVSRPLFQLDNLRIEAIQVLGALDEKLPQHILFRHKQLIGPYLK